MSRFCSDDFFIAKIEWFQEAKEMEPRNKIPMNEWLLHNSNDYSICPIHSALFNPMFATKGDKTGDSQFMPALFSINSTGMYWGCNCPNDIQSKRTICSYRRNMSDNEIKQLSDTWVNALQKIRTRTNNRAGIMSGAERERQIMELEEIRLYEQLEIAIWNRGVFNREKLQKARDEKKDLSIQEIDKVPINHGKLTASLRRNCRADRKAFCKYHRKVGDASPIIRWDMYDDCGICLLEMKVMETKTNESVYFESNSVNMTNELVNRGILNYDQAVGIIPLKDDELPDEIRLARQKIMQYNAEKDRLTSMNRKPKRNLDD